MLSLATPLIQLLTFLVLIWITNCDNFSLSTKLREIISLTNNVGQLPCLIGSLDDVAMILWFKDSSGTPIYSYDARLDKEPQHLAMQNDWGLRLYFRVWPNLRRSPALIIKDIRASDEGIYRCRVDYRNAPTTNYIMRLKVIQPPSHLEIIDTSTSRPIFDQHQMNPSSTQDSDITYMGPYHQGQNVTLKCNAYGGRPLPEVKWLKNGRMIDTSYEFVGNNYALNELRITNLGAQHSADLYTCEASNNNESNPISHSVNMDVYLRVNEIDLEVPDEMTAGVQYHLACKTRGAYPTVRIMWKMQRRVGPKYQMRSDADNVTTYNFPFKPEIRDDLETISCQAENPWLNDKPMVTSRTLKIKYTPVAILRFGQNKTTDFTEGESVLMECHVKANPAIFSIAWFHGTNQLFNNETSGVLITGMTLILTNLKPNSGGKYFCQAANMIGKERSNPLTIELNIAPKCVSSVVVSIPLAIGESHKLGCYIRAWPPDLNFYWTLNRSNDIVPILPMGNHTQGAIEAIHLADFDEYIFPITRTESDSTSNTRSKSTGEGAENTDGHTRNSGKVLEKNNFTKSPFSPGFSFSIRKTGSNETGLSLTDTEESEGALDGNPTKAVDSTYNQNLNQDHKLQQTTKVDSDGYLRIRQRRKSGNSVSATEIPHPVQEKELKLVDKKEEGLKRLDGLIHSLGGKSGPGGESFYGRWKAPEDSPDNIHHEAVLTYTIKSIDDYGLVACYGKNTVGSGLSPCIFHIIPRHEANQDEALGDGDRGGNGSLTSGTFQTAQDLRPMLDQKKKSGILVPSKLPMTSGIILMALLIFIASFALFLLLLVMLAKRKRQICRMIMTNKEQAAGKRKEENGEEKSAATFPSAGNPTTRPSCFQLRSSAIEKSASTVFLPCGLSYSSHSPTSSQHPLYPMGNQDLNLSLGRFYGKKHVGSGSGCGSEDGAASCFDLTPSETTTFTVISNQNDFPPPPTSIISTASTSHGYGSIEEDEDEEGIPGSN